MQTAFEPLFRANPDSVVIHIGHHSLAPYKLVVVPADYLMDAASAKALREYIEQGGTVLMRGYSAKVNEHAQWFETPLPGLLSDVFGLKTNAFYRAEQGLAFELEDGSARSDAKYYEVLEPSTAKVLSRFSNTAEHSPAVTINTFGKGRAVYLATESKPSAIGPVLDYLCKTVGVMPGPATPDGVYARVVERRTLYVKTTLQEKTDSRRGQPQGNHQPARARGDGAAGTAGSGPSRVTDGLLQKRKTAAMWQPFFVACCRTKLVQRCPGH